jgi:hypothetical protein
MHRDKPNYLEGRCPLYRLDWQKMSKSAPARPKLVPRRPRQGGDPLRPSIKRHRGERHDGFGRLLQMLVIIEELSGPRPKRMEQGIDGGDGIHVARIGIGAEMIKKPSGSRSRTRSSMARSAERMGWARRGSIPRTSPNLRPT